MPKLQNQIDKLKEYHKHLVMTLDLLTLRVGYLEGFLRGINFPPMPEYEKLLDEHMLTMGYKKKGPPAAPAAESPKEKIEREIKEFKMKPVKSGQPPISKKKEMTVKNGG